MDVTTLTGIVEDGQIRLADNVRLPEKATVFVVIPGVAIRPMAYVGSPRLRHPEQAADFQKEVVEDNGNAGTTSTARPRVLISGDQRSQIFQNTNPR